MLTYEAMQYFIAFANLGTLSAVAEKFNISQPTITRAMKKAEAEYGVSLFNRTKNTIKLNNNGIFAAEELSQLLKQTDEVAWKIQAHDRANRTISIGSSAAIQLPELLVRLTEAFPDKQIATELKMPSVLLDGLAKTVYQLIILPFVPNNPNYQYKRIGEEHLMFLLPASHRFTQRKSLTLKDMNGENMLLFSEIGFWAELVKSKMPNSHFLVQNERYSFSELVTNSILPCFTSDLVIANMGVPSKRVAVPIRDSEVNVTYYLVCKKQSKEIFSKLF